MPAVDYDYDYYEYKNSRNINKAAEPKRATKKGDSSVSVSTKTRESTKAQVRKAIYEDTKKGSSKRKKTDLDIPNRKSSQSKKSNVSNVKKKNIEQESLKKSNNKKQNIQKPVEMKLKKPELSPAQRKKAREKAINKAKNIFYLVTGFAIAFFICYRYSLINEKFNELEKTKRELATAQTVNEQIQADIDSQTDLSYIENYAKYQLGMQKPSNSQIVYVNVEKKDRILTPITIEEDSSKTWFEQLYEEIEKLFE